MDKDRPTPAGGRPRKFAEPSRPITLTLPLRTLKQLAEMDADRAKAIVRAVDFTALHGERFPDQVELIPVGSDGSLIVCESCAALTQLASVRVVSIGPGRCILAVPSGTSPAQIEVAVSDALEVLPRTAKKDRSILQALMALLRRVRHSRKMTKEEILIVSNA